MQERPDAAEAAWHAPCRSCAGLLLRRDPQTAGRRHGDAVLFDEPRRGHQRGVSRRTADRVPQSPAGRPTTAQAAGVAGGERGRVHRDHGRNPNDDLFEPSIAAAPTSHLSKVRCLGSPAPRSGAGARCSALGWHMRQALAPLPQRRMPGRSNRPLKRRWPLRCLAVSAYGIPTTCRDTNHLFVAAVPRIRGRARTQNFRGAPSQLGPYADVAMTRTSG